MLVLERCSPTMLKILNKRMLFLIDLPIKLTFRVQLLLASLIMTPSAYLHCLASLFRNKKFSLGFMLMAPLLFPFTAVFNGYTARDDTPSAQFEIEWSQLMKVYEGATNCNGKLQDLVKNIRDSLNIA